MTVAEEIEGNDVETEKSQLNVNQLLDMDLKDQVEGLKSIVKQRWDKDPPTTVLATIMNIVGRTSRFWTLFNQDFPNARALAASADDIERGLSQTY